MKQVAFALVLFGMVTVALCQGTVLFVNLGAFPTPADRLVYVNRADGGAPVPLTGTNYVAQLYYGADAASLQAHTAAPSRFRTTTTTSRGTWSGGTRTLTGFLAGSVAQMQVRVWDITQWPTFELACANGGFGATSAVFAYPVPAVGSPPSQFLMDNLRAVTLPTAPCPEPRGLLLALVPLALLLLFRRRKT